MTTHTIFLALGSNLGDREANLRQAIAALHPGVFTLNTSPVYETDPWGYLEQDTFLNQVIQAETELPPAALLRYIKNTETQLGRKPTFRYGPRHIDIDILFYDDLIVDTPRLQIPHPRLHERAFVLVPLADLAPGLIHPVLHRSILELLNNTDTSGVHRFKPVPPRSSETDQNDPA